MNEQDQIEQFNAAVDHLIHIGELPAMPDDDSLLEIAYTLAQTDLSAESQQVESTRQRLIAMVSSRHTGDKSMKHINRRLIASAAALLLFTAAVLIVPPLNTLAQQIIDFFIPASSDNSTVELYVGGTPPPTQDDPFPFSLEDLAQQVDFEYQLPGFVPAAYRFDGARYSPESQSITLNYHCAGPWALGVSQYRPTPEQLENLSQDVGASAVIEQIMIGDAVGQYVRGSWIVEVKPEVRQQAGETESAVAVTAESVWSNDSHWQRLDWYTNSVLYTVTTNGGIMGEGAEINNPSCLLDKDDYLQIARSLQPANAQE